MRTLVRGLALLEIISSLPHGAGVSELARQAGLDKGTTSRLLATLRREGYVRQRAGDRHYLLNGKVLRLARGYEGQLDLREAARPHLVRLRDATRETVHLAVREGRQVIYVDQLESERTVRLASVAGTSRPLHVTAMGRAILASLPDGEREELLAQLVADPGAGDLVADLHRVRDELARARRRGWATVDRRDDVCRVGVAVLDATGAPVGALSVSGPRYRMLEHQVDCATTAVATATAIGRELGA